MNPFSMHSLVTCTLGRKRLGTSHGGKTGNSFSARSFRIITNLILGGIHMFWTLIKRTRLILKASEVITSQLVTNNGAEFKNMPDHETSGTTPI